MVSLVTRHQLHVWALRMEIVAQLAIGAVPRMTIVAPVMAANSISGFAARRGKIRL